MLVLLLEKVLLLRLWDRLSNLLLLVVDDHFVGASCGTNNKLLLLRETGLLLKVYYLRVYLCFSSWTNRWAIN
jgi:hypothetical protein